MSFNEIIQIIAININQTCNCIKWLGKTEEKDMS